MTAFRYRAGASIRFGGDYSDDRVCVCIYMRLPGVSNEFLARSFLLDPDSIPALVSELERVYAEYTATSGNAVLDE